MNNFNCKSISHAYKHMILSVSHSPKSVCTKFIAAKTTSINQQQFAMV